MSLIGRLYTFLILTRYKPPPGIKLLSSVVYYPGARLFSFDLVVAGRVESFIVGRPPWGSRRRRQTHVMLDTMIRQMDEQGRRLRRVDAPEGESVDWWIERRRRKGAR